MGAVADVKHSVQNPSLGRGDCIMSDEATNVPGYDSTLQIESGETRKALLKVDFLILPVIVLCFCFLQFDRTNIGNALTDTLRTDINIVNADINLAQTLFTVGFIVTELPFNMISRYVGPERFLPITMFLWGVATWSQVFLRNASGLCAARFFIGALEGGYIPGFALYISKFYTNQELALRYAIFWASNSFAGALSGPLSIGLLSLGGRGGLRGWQWLFLIGKNGISSYLAPCANNVTRGCLDLLPSSFCLPLFPTYCCEAQVLLRKILQHVHRARSIHPHHPRDP
jgi:sugar phosphate permease